ncbi:MAG TPA: methylmalonyl-CoA mutase family protein, partial [Polyangia bacterium]|nr:methylmalonyl-CoA mutase family protein [Polyangia bacterium]
YYVEALTDRMEEAAGQILRTIDEMGGIVAAVEAGWPQREIAASAYRTQRQIDSGERAVVGVNRHITTQPSGSIPTLKIDGTPERVQLAAIEALRARRDATAVQAGLDGVRRASEGDGNLMEAVLEAARRDATLGEICQIFRDVFGEYRDPAEV